MEGCRDERRRLSVRGPRTHPPREPPLRGLRPRPPLHHSEFLHAHDGEWRHRKCDPRHSHPHRPHRRDRTPCRHLDRDLSGRIREESPRRRGPVLRRRHDPDPPIVVGIFAFSLILELGATGIVSQRPVFRTATGVIALSTIIIPFVARTSEEALRLVPISTRESALALGIPRYRAILRVVLPSSSS